MKLTSRRGTPIVPAASLVAGALLSLVVVAWKQPEDLLAKPPLDLPDDARDVITSFQRARVGTDELPAAAAKMLSSISADSPTPTLDPGTILALESRRVIHTDKADVYLVPTRENQVCLAILPAGIAGCTDGARLAQDGLDWGLFDVDGIGYWSEPTVIHGLVAESVTLVEFEGPHGETSAAVIADGAFYTEHALLPKALVVHFEDGSVRRITIPERPS